ncbi:hypothetical protein RB195_002016 [Necator americanus]|uniref:Uncharacterized protein n=1 Tax=Necator americanus TaxID=51031 RepID=A0ABR1DI26_NECAM
MKIAFYGLLVLNTKLPLISIVCANSKVSERLVYRNLDVLGVFVHFPTIFFICLTTSISALLYSYMNFFESSHCLIITANILWRMSHGVHGFVYVLINRLIRRGVWSMLTCAKVDQSQGNYDGNEAIVITLLKKDKCSLLYRCHQILLSCFADVNSVKCHSDAGLGSSSGLKEKKD